jgi:hypothetical protein
MADADPGAEFAQPGEPRPVLLVGAGDGHPAPEQDLGE